MTLTLKARYRNAKAERVPFKDMSPALRCMVLLNEYRQLREYLPSGDDRTVAWAETGMEYTAREFDAAREEMRRGFRATASIAQLERLADNPMQVAL